MQTDLQSLVQTWEAPDSKIIFEGYEVLDKNNALSVCLPVAGFFVTSFSAMIPGMPKEVFSNLLGVTFFLFFAHIVFVFRLAYLRDKYAEQQFFKKQDLYDDQTFISDVEQTETPYYHEVLKAERLDLSKVPPAFRDLPDAEQLVLVDTQELKSSSTDHQSSTRWIFYLDPHQSIPIQPGDHLVSLYGEKKEDSYAVHAQSCKISSPKITIPPDSVLLSLKSYLDALTNQKEASD